MDFWTISLVITIILVLITVIFFSWFAIKKERIPFWVWIILIITIFFGIITLALWISSSLSREPVKDQTSIKRTTVTTEDTDTLPRKTTVTRRTINGRPASPRLSASAVDTGPSNGNLGRSTVVRTYLD